MESNHTLRRVLASFVTHRFICASGHLNQTIKCLTGLRVLLVVLLQLLTVRHMPVRIEYLLILQECHSLTGGSLSPMS